MWECGGMDGRSWGWAERICGEGVEVASSYGPTVPIGYQVPIVRNRLIKDEIRDGLGLGEVGG